MTGVADTIEIAPHDRVARRSVARSGVRAGSASWRYIRSAPGTFIWLAILFVTTVVAHHLASAELTDLLRSRSTNLHHLMHNPLPSLVRSAFWIDGNGWFAYATVYVAIHATVERWLGTARWLAVVVTAHVGATYISQSVLLWAISTHHAPHSDLDVIDVGVSYGLAGVAGTLLYRLRRPWRWFYLAALLVVCVTPVVWPLLNGSHGTFTDIGHLCAALIGLLCYPLTRIGMHSRELRVELPPVSPHIVERVDADASLRRCPRASSNGSRASTDRVEVGNRGVRAAQQDTQ